jgi:hypothetical protein
MTGVDVRHVLARYHSFCTISGIGLSSTHNGQRLSFPDYWPSIARFLCHLPNPDDLIPLKLLCHDQAPVNEAAARIADILKVSDDFVRIEPARATGANCPLSQPKGWKARVIHDDLTATLGPEVVAPRTMMKDLPEAQISPGNTTASSDVTSPHIEDSDEAILNP